MPRKKKFSQKKKSEEKLKIVVNEPSMVAYNYILNTREAEAGGLLQARPVWAA